MSQTRSIRRMLVALGLVSLFLAPVIVKGGKNENNWDEKFKGHEMWLTDLDKALTLSAEENKPILIDIYSRG